MKTIVYNNDKLVEKDINRISRRAKAVIKNKKNEILLACSNGNYHLPGGHLEDNETYEACLVREIEEETGVNIGHFEGEPILKIVYYNRDYPEAGTNSKTEANYYEVKYELIPDFSKIKLTEDEKNGNFKLEYIKEDQILYVLNESLKTCTRKGVVKDTIEALKEYLNNKR